MTQDLKEKLQALQDLWARYSTLISDENEEFNSKEVSRILNEVLCPDTCPYCILDLSNRKISYINEDFRQELGLKRKTISLKSFVRLVHPLDFPHLLLVKQLMFEFFQKEIATENIQNYRVSYLLRLYVNKIRHNLYNIQLIPLQQKGQGQLNSLLCLLTNVAHITKTNNYRVSIIGLNNEPSYLNINPYTTTNGPLKNSSLFSIRELEVIRLLAEGLKASEIAEELNIAVATVRTHRKNILNKTGYRNAPELVANCIRDGLI